MKLYAKQAIARIGQIGATIAVIGSGSSRNVPDGFARDKAREQIAHFLTIVAYEADESSVTIAIEPLNRKESNVINSVVCCL